jgi:hypothetical protein
VQVVEVELNSGTVRRARQPKVKILAVLLGLEEENHIAGVQVGEGVEEEVVASGLLFSIELGLFVGVGEETTDIRHQVSVARKK